MLHVRSDTYKPVAISGVSKRIPGLSRVVAVRIPAEIINRAAADVLDGAKTESGLGQKGLAARAGMSQVTVQKLLSGNQSIKIPQFLNLAMATDLSPAEIINRIEAKVQKMMSQGPSISDEWIEDRHEQAAAMTPEELENYGLAATRDAELDEDEPEAP